MLYWVYILLASLIMLLLVEEVSQFIWRIYLRDPNEKKETTLRRFIENAKRTMNKYRKNPSH